MSNQENETSGVPVPTLEIAEFHTDGIPPFRRRLLRPKSEISTFLSVGRRRSLRR
jgi:hypothetical protein